MQVLPVDLVALVSAILGISVVLVPVIGVTARFALKPTVEALGRLFETRGTEDAIRILERRIELQDQELELLRSSVRQLSEADDFNRQLAAAPPSDATGD